MLFFFKKKMLISNEEKKHKQKPKTKHQTAHSAKEMDRWYSTCPACTSPWVSPPNI